MNHRTDYWSWSFQTLIKLNQMQGGAPSSENQVLCEGCRSSRGKSTAGGDFILMPRPLKEGKQRLLEAACFAVSCLEAPPADSCQTAHAHLTWPMCPALLCRFRLHMSPTGEERSDMNTLCASHTANPNNLLQHMFWAGEISLNASVIASACRATCRLTTKSLWSRVEVIYFSLTFHMKLCYRNLEITSLKLFMLPKLKSYFFQCYFFNLQHCHITQGSVLFLYWKTWTKTVWSSLCRSLFFLHWADHLQEFETRDRLRDP